MAFCCVCGNKISLMDYSYNFSTKTGNEKICLTCNTQIQKFDHPQEQEEIEEAKTYLGKYSNVYCHNVNVKEKIEQILKEAQEKSIEGNRKSNYREALNRISNFIEKPSVVDCEVMNKNLEYLMEHKLVTSGYSLDGYKISEYKGIISGDTVIGTGFMSGISASFSDFFGVEADEFAQKIKKARNAALTKLIADVARIGGNAIIGVDFETTIFSNNIIGVTAHGTAVKVEGTEN